jgi:hypothetical protein
MSAKTSQAADTGCSRDLGASWRYWLCATLGGVLIATLSLAMFGVSGRDDPYITFSAAEAIRDSAALVNINGDPIEQSTTLLFTLLLVLLSAILPVPVPELGWFLSLSALVGVVITAFALLRRSLPPIRALIGSWLVGLTPPLVYWSTSGAEQSLSILLALLSIMLVTKPSVPGVHVWLALSAAVFTLLTFLSRPDVGLAVTGATTLLFIGRLLVGRRRGQLLLVAIIVGQIGLIGLLTITRLSVTGSPLPQPLNAKVGGSLIEQGLRGLDYLTSNAFSWWFIAVVISGVCATWVMRRHAWSSTQVLLLLVALILLAGGVFSGGDWMELGRFFAAPATMLTVLTVTLIGSLSSRFFAVFSGVIAVVQVATMALWSQAPATFESRGSSLVSRWTLNTTGSSGIPTELDTPFNRWNADHLGDAYFLGAATPVIADILAKYPDRTLTITSGQGGMIPYHLQREFGDRIRFIDRFQLMTDDFVDCGLTPGPYGAFISWNQWADLAGECAPALPDIAFSIGPIPYDDLGDDYDVVVHVEGAAERNGQSLPQEQWLAARKDLLTAE